MRRKLLTALILTVGSLVAGAALAEEIVYFTNGTTMAIRTHSVADGVITVDLGQDSFIAFPASKVERIETAGRDVYLSPSRSNVAAPGSGRGGGRIQSGGAVVSNSQPMRGTTSISSGFRSNKAAPGYDGLTYAPASPGMVTRPDANGIETAYPLANHPNRSAREIGVQGVVPRMGQGADAVLGAKRVGSKNVIMSSRYSMHGKRRPDVIQIQPSVGPAKPTSEPPPRQPGKKDSGAAAGSNGGQ